MTTAARDGAGDGLVAVIMAGGVGTRFWPLSTEDRPKQFLRLFGDRSLLQLSFDRLDGLISAERTFVLTNTRHVELVQQQLPELPAANIIAEPMRRDTAAAVCLGAVLARQRFGNPVILTLTADHLIEPTTLFHITLCSAAHQAQNTGALYTLGIQPAYPAVGYGYLEQGALVHEDNGVRHFELGRFVEKPDLETAQSYLERGGFLWNSGMFVWTADAILAEIAVHLPDHHRALSAVAEHDRGPSWDDSLLEAFATIEPISVDYGVMEKAAAIRCVAAPFEWRDVGGWLALYDLLPTDEHGNAARGDLLIRDAARNLVFSDDDSETTMLVGVDDLVVVRAGKRTLIVHRDRVEEIKELVRRLEG